MKSSQRRIHKEALLVRDPKKSRGRLVEDLPALIPDLGKETKAYMGNAIFKIPDSYPFRPPRIEWSIRGRSYPHKEVLRKAMDVVNNSGTRRASERSPNGIRLECLFCGSKLRDENWNASTLAGEIYQEGKEAQRVIREAESTWWTHLKMERIGLGDLTIAPYLFPLAERPDGVHV